MSDHTTPSLARLDALMPLLKGASTGPHHAQLIEEAEALRRAVAAFHMEAIRFRMYSVDRLLNLEGDTGERRRIFEELRHELEVAGFHTRSHTAP